MKKVAILLEDFVEESEFLYPYYRFQEEGWEVVIVAPEVREYRGKNGLKFKSQVRIEDAMEKEFDLVFIPGGYAPDRLRRNKTVLNFVREMYESGKPVCTICHGPWVLISAGLIKGKRVTGYFAIKDDIINAGGNYTGNPYERDDNIFTATDPGAMPAYIKFIIDNIS